MPILFDETPGAGLQSASDTLATAQALENEQLKADLEAEKARRQIESEDAFAEAMGLSEQSRAPINDFMPKDPQQRAAEWTRIAGRIKDSRLAGAFLKMRRNDLDLEDLDRQQRDFANMLEAQEAQGFLDPKVREGITTIADAEGDPDTQRQALVEAKREYMKYARSQAKLERDIERREMDVQSADQAAAGFSKSGQGAYGLAKRQYLRGSLTPYQFERSIASIQRMEMAGRRRMDELYEKRQEAEEALNERLELAEITEEEHEALLADLDERFDRSIAGLDGAGGAAPGGGGVVDPRGKVTGGEVGGAGLAEWEALPPDAQQSFVDQARAAVRGMSTEQIVAYLKQQGFDDLPEDVIAAILARSGPATGENLEKMQRRGVIMHEVPELDPLPQGAQNANSSANDIITVGGGGA